MTTLLACPFCGHVPEIDDPDFVYPTNREKTLWNAVCTNGGGGGCGCAVLEDNRDDAIEAWNRRAPPVAIAHEAVELPLNPTPAMLDAGAQRLVSFEDGSVWPDSWEPHQIAGARNEAERVWRSMVLAWAEGQDPGVQPGVKCASCGLHRPLDRFALLATPTASDRPAVRAEDAKDAERYRFWRKFYSVTFAISGRHKLSFRPSRPQVEIAGPFYETVVDAAIDAAMLADRAAPPSEKAS